MERWVETVKEHKIETREVGRKPEKYGILKTQSSNCFQEEGKINHQKLIDQVK